MIIRFHSKTPGTPLEQRDIERESFVLIDKTGNRWQLSDDRSGFMITSVEGSEGISPGLKVFPVSAHDLTVEMRP